MERVSSDSLRPISRISQTLPKSIHAVTAKGFELKVALFMIAFAIKVLSDTTWINIGQTSRHVALVGANRSHIDLLCRRNARLVDQMA